MHRDLNAGVGLRHRPSGRFSANAAWLVAATLQAAPARRLALAAWFELALARLRCVAYTT